MGTPTQTVVPVAIPGGKLLRIQISSSRGGGQVQSHQSLYNFNGVPVTEALEQREDVIPLNPIALEDPQAGGGGTPSFPQAAYDEAAAKGDNEGALRILEDHQTKVMAAMAGTVAGPINTLEERTISGVLEYCYEKLGYSPTDAQDRFVIRREDVALTKATEKFNGQELETWTVRIASRFGLHRS